MSTQQPRGSWRINAGDEHTVMDDQQRRLVSVPCGGLSGHTFAEAADIARLIAAAPDLLKVAEEIDAASNGGGDTIGLLIELHRIAAGARLVIAKARGGQ